MVIRFQPDGVRSAHAPDPVAHPGGPSADPVAFPAQILERHGARILRPTSSATFAGAPRVRSTAYRTQFLLVPNSLFDKEHREELGRVQGFLAGAGLRLAAEAVEPLERLLPESLDRYIPLLGDVLRRVPLEPAPENTEPVVVDAWPALQRLRMAVRTPDKKVRAVVHRVDDTLRDLVNRFALEHLLVGALGDPPPDPITDGHPVGSGPGASSYLLAGGGGRGPVDVVMHAPPRRRLGEPGLGRRPVVAVLDTGMGPHPWLDASPKPSDDAFVELDLALQAAVAGNGSPAPLSDPWDVPFTDEPLVGELNTHTGHGTFIAGIVRQVAPDARVRSIRIMHPDGIAYEHDLLMVIAIMTAQAVTVQNGTGDELDFVDVLSLSLGFYSEEPTSVVLVRELAGRLAQLTELGVLVVCSAGNDSTDRPCYPAALASMLPGRLLSVGALNPNGSRALFSNDGPWVDCWADGAAVISTYPTVIDGSRRPANAMHEDNAPGLPQRRESIDPDDFRSGFATWSGTSFAAPLVAGSLAAALLHEARKDPAIRLEQLDQAAVAARAAAALEAIGG